MAKESRINLTHTLMTKLVTTRNNIRMQPRNILIVYIVNLRRHIIHYELYVYTLLKYLVGSTNYVITTGNIHFLLV